MNKKAKIDSEMEARIDGLASRASGLKRGQKGKVAGGVPLGLRAEICRTLGVSRATFYRYVRPLRAQWARSLHRSQAVTAAHDEITKIRE